MSCADVVAQTRGKASSRPNKFILPVDFTSERPQRGGGNRIDYALTSRPKGAKAVRADPNDTICHLCEGDGALMVYRLYLCSMLQYQELSHMFFFFWVVWQLCDGPCRRSFHRACYDKYQGRFLPAPDKLFQADDSAHESVPIQTESCDVDAPAQDQSAAAADATNSETWCCTDCTYQSQVCAICHQRGDVSYGEDNMELQRCKINLCGRYIHPGLTFSIG
jgi:hypothetical protein